MDEKGKSNRVRKTFRRTLTCRTKRKAAQREKEIKIDVLFDSFLNYSPTFTEIPQVMILDAESAKRKREKK